MKTDTETSTPSPVFILGVGAQKAGTTWLHQYLMQDPVVNMGCLKEYHVWDAVFQPELHPQLKHLTTRPDRPEHAVRRLMQEIPGNYEHYFRQLINERIRITGDITPGYSSLTAAQFIQVREAVESQGFNMRVVFLIREPAARCWSAAKMVLRNRELTAEEQADLARQHFLNILQNDGVQRRTRYEDTIEALRTAFNREQLYVGLYENMFEPEHINALSRFLGVAARPEFAGQVHNSTESLAMPPGLREACNTEFADTYAYCSEHFPATRTLWCQDNSEKEEKSQLGNLASLLPWFKK